MRFSERHPRDVVGSSLPLFGEVEGFFFPQYFQITYVLTQNDTNHYSANCEIKSH